MQLSAEARSALVQIGRRRRNKYSAKREKVDGLWFDSKAEAKRYRELKIMLTAGIIEGLQMHPRYALKTVEEDTGRVVVVGHYVADFWYKRAGQPVVEDVKGLRTETYEWKKRHFAAQYGMEITEIGGQKKKAKR